MSKNDARPFPIQLEVEFLDRLSEPVRDGRAKSVSEIIRSALQRFDLNNVVVVRPSQLAISVRLPGDIRRNLKKVARAKHTSIGQLVRAAVEAYLPEVESGAAGQLEIPAVAADLAAAEQEKAAVKAPQKKKRRTASRAKPKSKARPKKAAKPARKTGKKR